MLRVRLTALMVGRAVEITDLLWPVDSAGLALPVSRDDAVATLLEHGQNRAARLVAAMPHEAGLIDSGYRAGLVLRIHRELTRLGEELQLARRIASLLEPEIARLQQASADPVVVLDVGCGLGHVLRSISLHRHLPDNVELVGVDFNGVLIAEADRLAKLEGANCRFEHGNALDVGRHGIDPTRTIVISSGFLHHLDPDELRSFFAAQASAGFAGFAHWDIAPCFWSAVGAWVFHQARMREPVSRHDGVLSAVRAYPAATLLEAAASGAPGYSASVLEGPRWYPRALDVLRPIVGWR